MMAGHRMLCDFRNQAPNYHRDRCSCGWEGAWTISSGLAHAAYDQHLESTEESGSAGR